MVSRPRPAVAGRSRPSVGRPWAKGTVRRREAARSSRDAVTRCAGMQPSSLPAHGRRPSGARPAWSRRQAEERAAHAVRRSPARVPAGDGLTKERKSEHEDWGHAAGTGSIRLRRWAAVGGDRAHGPACSVSTLKFCHKLDAVSTGGRLSSRLSSGRRATPPRSQRWRWPACSYLVAPLRTPARTSRNA